MAVVVVEILILPIELNDYTLLFGILTSLAISITSIYVIKFNKPIISIRDLLSLQLYISYLWAVTVMDLHFYILFLKLL